MQSAANPDPVRHPHAAARSIARQLCGLQVLATLAVALAWLLRSPQDALGAAAGGLSVAAGTWILGRRMFKGDAVSAGRAFIGLIVGSLLRWMVIAMGVVLAIGTAQWPPLAVMSGLIFALLVQLYGLRLDAQSQAGAISG